LKPCLTGKTNDTPQYMNFNTVVKFTGLRMRVKTGLLE
jgi:hypothetical protein